MLIEVMFRAFSSYSSVLIDLAMPSREFSPQISALLSVCGLIPSNLQQNYHQLFYSLDDDI